MTDIQGYLQNWSLSDPQPLAETATSRVFTVMFEGAPAVLKLLTPLGARDEKNGALALQYFDGKGAVRLLRHDDRAHLLEYAEGGDLAAMVRRGQDAEAAGIIGDVLNALHAERRTPPPGELTPLRRWFQSLFRQAGAEKPDSIYARAAAAAERLLAREREPRALHGDIHHENIRQSKRGWLAIDPKGLCGERSFDAANALCNPQGMEALVQDEARLLRNAEIIAGKMGADRARLLAFVFAYGALSASWCIEDGQDPAHALAMARLAEPHAVV